MACPPLAPPHPRPPYNTLSRDRAISKIAAKFPTLTLLASLAMLATGLRGKQDMGSILASLSTDDGDTWEEPVTVFDHNQRQGTLQFASANPVHFKPPGQDVLWCFAMRCPIVYRDSEDSQLVGAFSADGGRLWTPAELSGHYSGPLILNGAPYPTDIRGRKLFVLPAHRNTLLEYIKVPEVLRNDLDDVPAATLRLQQVRIPDEHQLVVKKGRWKEAVKQRLARWLPKTNRPEVPGKKAYRFDPKKYTWTRLKE